MRPLQGGEVRAVMWGSQDPERPVVSEEEWGFWGGPLGDDSPGGEQVVAIRGATSSAGVSSEGGWGDSQDEPGGWAAARPALASQPFVESPQGILNVEVAGR